MFNNNKVSKIEFHIKHYELEDFILRAAKLIEDGYRIERINVDSIKVNYFEEPEPPYHIVFTKKEIF